MVRSLSHSALLVAILWGIPLVASAAIGVAPTDFKSLAKLAIEIINTLTVLAVGVGIVYYMWGVVTALNESGSAKAWERLRVQIVWGILALFVMFSIGGILRVLTSSLFP